MSYSVGQVSRFAKVTVRTLHHYDEIKLLSPSHRTPSGYRRYDDADLDRLQQILFYRELGFSLDDIASILDDSEVSPSEHLRRQRSLLLGRIDRLQEMVASVEHALEARKMGIQLTPEEKFEVFGEDYVDHQDEAEQRWGNTDAWKQSQRRAAQYDKQDWVEIQAEGDELNRRIAEAIGAGVASDSEQAMRIAEDHREHITRRFFDVSYGMHRCMADMYIADPRFTETYEKVAPGAAAWFRGAIVANADRAEA
ncbi:MerR family transcriptional regulator [Streptacidiphilus jiangxiensis]|uniref:DNA-binding transcriptional regulator, MerR family n=1 Tax=Streptacidiphilus jiangxiensis TaxID=235985 RepID=A0A1H7J1U7_STRJI|nr:MerR family transcriptional regulator [Streptacidiphilus jiangxiensis]SEK68723.1 DNA-binding transcriptional regulator, MerR family [Streptacidiphilus jiangxiensis]